MNGDGTSPASDDRAATVEDRIVAATEQLLGSRSLGALTLDDVAAATGLATDVLERHFPSIDRIAAKLLRNFLDRLNEGAAWLSAPPDADFQDLIGRQARNVAGLYARHGAVIAALSEASAANPEVQSLWATTVEDRARMVADRLRELSTLGVVRGLDADLVAPALVLMVHHTLVHLYRHRTEVPIDEAAAALCGVWFHAVFPDRTATAA